MSQPINPVESNTADNALSGDKKHINGKEEVAINGKEEVAINGKEEVGHTAGQQDEESRDSTAQSASGDDEEGEETGKNGHEDEEEEGDGHQAGEEEDEDHSQQGKNGKHAVASEADSATADALNGSNAAKGRKRVSDQAETGEDVEGNGKSGEDSTNSPTKKKTKAADESLASAEAQVIAEAD